MEQNKNTELNQGFFFFFFQVCDVNKLVMIPQEDLAKFGHRPDMKNVSVFAPLAPSRHVLRKKNEVTIFRQ